MGEILDKSRMYIHNDDGDYTLETDIIQDIRDHIAYCKELRNRPGQRLLGQAQWADGGEYSIRGLLERLAGRLRHGMRGQADCP
jgi:hypothetical protein